MTDIETREVLTPDDGVSTLLARHHADMREGSPEESCHVMTADALRSSGARVFALYEGSDTLAVGALKPLAVGDAPGRFSATSGPVFELKSMHVAQAARGRGLGRLLLDALLAEARRAHAAGVCLETGTAASFAPARGLYLARGFKPCPPFADYREDPLSVYMALPFSSA